MNLELLEYIKSLSLKDKKTLSQKALKVSEESGELAKVILPFDNAHGTTHRFIEKGRILEEVADVLLTAVSIAYELGYSHEDLEDMMWNKAEKWHSIQAKEDKVDYPIPYEIHVTVDIQDYVEFLYRLEMEMQAGRTGRSFYIAKEKEELWPIAVEDFKQTCLSAGVKPIVLDLENSGEIVMQDVMTSSHHIGNNSSAYEECIRVAGKLEKNNFKVVRKKIETVPWHPAAPVDLRDKMPSDCYFEAHIGCIISPIQKSELESIADSFGAHLSKNFFKKLEDGRFVNMLTKREYDSRRETFEIAVDTIKSALDSCGIQYEKVITEFSIYDTKISHDFKWLS